MKIRIITMAIAILFLSSCASIIHGSKQTVEFSSLPSGATITIDGKDYGKTPQSIVLRRKAKEKGDQSDKKSYKVKITLDGYAPYEMEIKRKVDSWVFGNILFGGLIGVIIDSSSGAMYKLTPEQVNAQMGNNSTGMIDQKNGGIYVSVTLKANPNWEKIGQLDSVVK